MHFMETFLRVVMIFRDHLLFVLFALEKASLQQQQKISHKNNLFMF